jgi:uroporphyrinogen decarboxylase
MTLKNDLLLRAIRREPVDMTPVWIMRQAGRYLPEYRATRARAGSFLQLCKTPELACEVTLQPLNRFPLDAAILFSDILTIPDAMGLGLYFKEGEGPGFERPLRTAKDIQSLGIPDPELSLRYVLDAIRLTQHELDGKVPLIGFCGSPWTIACYMVEGQANKSFPHIQKMRQSEPQLLHHLLDVMAQSISLHLKAQIAAGVQVVMIFDTWGGMLDTDNYKNFSLKYIQQVISELTKIHTTQRIPVILYTKEGGKWLELIADSGCDMVGVDWHTSLNEARDRVGHKVALQGNMDPAILLKNPDVIRAETARVLQEFGPGTGHVFNLGHGITPDVPPENVAVLVDAVHNLSREYHGR